jgi:K+-sensing histidine kinase KdpD
LYLKRKYTDGPRKGSGSIVDRIAKAHGGTVQLFNRDGGGLAATVTLPMAGR